MTSVVARTEILALQIKVFSATFGREIIGTEELYTFKISSDSDSYEYVKHAMRRLSRHSSTLPDGSIMIIIGKIPGSIDRARAWLDEFGKGERWVTVTCPARGCLVALRVDGVPFDDIASNVLRSTRFPHDELASVVIPVPYEDLPEVERFDPEEFRETSTTSSDSEAAGSLASRLRKLFFG